MAGAAIRQPRVVFRFFAGCQYWRPAYDQLLQALRDEGFAEVEPVPEVVLTELDADRLHFVGSPTILINDRDPFGEEGMAFGLNCRVYGTRDGPAHSPTIEQLREAIRAATSTTT